MAAIAAVLIIIVASLSTAAEPQAVEAIGEPQTTDPCEPGYYRPAEPGEYQVNVKCI